MGSIWDKMFGKEEKKNLEDSSIDTIMEMQLGKYQYHLERAKQEALEKYQTQQAIYQAMQLPNKPLRAKTFDIFERTQIALQELHMLYSAGQLEKHELLHTMKMVKSVDQENLVVVEEIIKSKLG